MSGLSGLRAENWASVVLWATNSTESSAIYKLTSCFADYLNFWIAGCQSGGLKIGLLLFCGLQIAPRVPRYTN
jgi:hypothetical protein